MSRRLRPATLAHGLASALWRLRPRALLQALEAEQDRWFVWLPVLLGCGIGVYFALPVEPPVVVAAGGLAVPLGVWLAHTRGLGGRLFAGSLLTVAIGFAAAQTRTIVADAPAIDRPTGIVTVKGWVEEVEQRGSGAYRVTLRTAAIEGFERNLPRRVRVRVQGSADGVRIGTPVQVQARLTAPPLPALPGDYDFARRAYFQRIGAVGSAQSALTVLPVDGGLGADSAAGIGPPPWSVTVWAPGENLRRIVAERIRSVLQGDRGAIATALIQGDQGGISEKAMQTMRDSGLAHILSISGLHMAIIAGTLFWVIRALLALSPFVAQTYPVRAIAAIVACAGALFYLMLSGWQVPAVRSFVMIAIMFLAIVMARPALSLRNVALAALILLVARPENLLDVSFLMSFAATTGLVALYEEIAERRRNRAEPPEPAGLVRRMLALVGADVLTTLVAGLSVAPLGAYFFHTFQHYAVLGNLLALPIVSLWLMPLVPVVLIAMLAGLEALPLQALAYGVDALLAVGTWVASLPGSISAIPAMPLAAVVIMMLGALWLALWRRPWRWLGLAMIGIGGWAALERHPPDVLVGRDGAALAIRLEDGSLSALAGRRGSYELVRWLEHDGDRRGADAAAQGRGFSCDTIGCTARIGAILLAYVTDPAKLAGTCVRADVVVSRFPKERACLEAPIVIDRSALRTAGAHLLRITGSAVHVSTLADHRGDRPWTRTGRSKLASARQEASGDRPRARRVQGSATQPQPPGDPRPETPSPELGRSDDRW